MKCIDRLIKHQTCLFKMSKRFCFIFSFIFKINRLLTFLPLLCTWQFLVKTPPLTVNCNDKPVFVSPTLAQGFTVHIDILKALNVSFYVFGKSDVNNLCCFFFVPIILSLITWKFQIYSYVIHCLDLRFTTSLIFWHFEFFFFCVCDILFL